MTLCCQPLYLGFKLNYESYRQVTAFGTATFQWVTSLYQQEEQTRDRRTHLLTVHKAHHTPSGLPIGRSKTWVRGYAGRRTTGKFVHLIPDSILDQSPSPWTWSIPNSFNL